MKSPPRETRVNVQSLLCLHSRTLSVTLLELEAGSKCSSHTEVEKRKQRGMASTSGGVESSGLAIGSTRAIPGGLAAELACSAIADGRWAV